MCKKLQTRVLEMKKEDSEMKKKVIGYVALIIVIGLLPQRARAASAFKTFSGLGTGGVVIAGTCADISCAGGHSCFCAEDGNSVQWNRWNRCRQRPHRNAHG
jgi:hypothetical protein